MALSKESPRELMRCSKELTASIKSWSSNREETVKALRQLADELMEHHKNVHIAKVSGSSFSIAGFALIATGFGLAPVSFGTSLLLSAVGGAVCAGGGVTAAGAGVVKNRIFKFKLAKAQELIEADRDAQESVKKHMDDINKLRRKASNPSITHLAFDASLASLIKNLVDVSKFAKAGTRAATTAASEGVEGVLRTIGVASNAVRIGLFDVSVALLPLDIYTLVTSAQEIDSTRKGDKDKAPEAVQKLRALADELQREMEEMLQAVWQFENTMTLRVVL